MHHSSRTPRVSIGMPVYNGQRYIAETIDSLLTQTFNDFELIICDNASTDHTQEICRSYALRDTRIQYFSNLTNCGAAKNYRLAFERSSTEYFRWANSDDVFGPTSLERCVEVLDRDPSVVLTYPKTQLIDAFGRPVSSYDDALHLVSPNASQRFIQLSHNLGLVNAIYGLMRADILRITKFIRPFPGGDIPFMAELTLYGKFWEIPEILFYRRLHRDASSSYQTVEQAQHFFDPASVGSPSLRVLRTLFAHLDSIHRSPTPPFQKLSLFYFLFRSLVGQRSSVCRELLEAQRWIARRYFRCTSA